MNEHNKYFAFISYKREGIDEKVANWIHNKLEKYPYPKDLVKEENRPNDPDNIRKVFIDTKELPVTDKEFANKINESIMDSRYMIIICSSKSAQSEFVSREVEYFLSTHNNDTGMVLPVFIDVVNERLLPEVLRDKGVLERNCPVYKSSFEPKSEINQYCFYHIVSFLLKVDFNNIYDRYHIYSLKKKRELKLLRWIFYTMLTALVFFLGSWVYNQYLLSQKREEVIQKQEEIISKQEEIVQLEKEIFPYSVVTGYVRNFLSPVIEYIKNNEPESHIYVHMPINSKDLDHDHIDRFKNISSYITNILKLDSIRQVTLKTRMPRGSNVHKLYSRPEDALDGKYLDFASTTSTFLAIARKKKEKSVYKDVGIDTMIKEYTDIFILQAKEILKDDSLHVTFVTSIQDIAKE